MQKLIYHVLLVAGISLIMLQHFGNANEIGINTVFFLDDDQQDSFIAEVAIRDAKRIIEAKKHRFRYQTLKYSSDQTFEAGQIACNSDPVKLAAIFGPESPEINEVMQSVALKLRIPQFQTIPNAKLNSLLTRDMDSSPPIFNLYPHPKFISQAISTLVNHWKKFTVLYESEEGLAVLQESLTQKMAESAITYRKLGNGPDYRWALKEIKEHKETNFILNCKSSRIFEVLRAAKQVNLTEDFHSYILTDLDALTLNWSEFANIRSNITAIRLFDPNIPSFRNVIKTWAIRSDLIKTKTALLYDALNVFITSFSIIATQGQLSVISRLECRYSEEIDGNLAFYGERMGQYLRAKKSFNKGILGSPLTGPVSFSPTGERVDFQLQFMENVYKQDVFRHVATWHSDRPLEFQQIVSSEQRSEEDKKEMQQNRFKVSSKLTDPYLMKKNTNDSTSLVGNDRFEGYAIDLMQEICRRHNCSFDFELVPDDKPGNYDPETKQWDGMIRQLLDNVTFSLILTPQEEDREANLTKTTLGQKADLAVGDLTITYQRKKAVDFSSPFMTLGISVLYAKASKEPPELLSFARPFSPKVWLYVATAYLIISLLIFVTARLNPNDWEGPHPCEPNPMELENIWNIRNCSWLTLGSFMQQGCDLLPKGISTRMATAAWWFFTLIMTAAYTANMAAFLTMERMESTIKSAVDLASQSKIKYGCLEGGATCAFFKDTNFSTYHKMWVQMESADPSVLVDKNEKGVRRVLESKRSYAFLMESASIEYETAKNCKLTQVGLPIDSKGYGIAMSQNFRFRKEINEAILKMQEEGFLHRLKEIWWVQNNKRDEVCEEDKHSSDDAAAELGLDNVGGVFVVLTVGVLTSLLFATFEFLWLVKKIAIKEHISFKEAFQMELTFAFNIWERQKKVKKYQSTEEINAGEKLVRF